MIKKHTVKCLENTNLGLGEPWYLVSCMWSIKEKKKFIYKDWLILFLQYYKRCMISAPKNSQEFTGSAGPEMLQ